MILIKNGKAVGRNAVYNGWRCPPRPVIYYTTDGELKYEIVQNVNLLSTPIHSIRWGVGGGSIIGTRIASENWGSDVTRVGARRTGMAIKDGYVYLIVSDEGMSLVAFGDKIREALGTVQGIFLDGGGSSQMMYKGKSVVKSTRKVDNGIFVVDK